jgi:hypothetical protein
LKPAIKDSDRINNANCRKQDPQIMSEAAKLNMIMDNEDGNDGGPAMSISDASDTGASGSKSGHDHNETQDEAEKEMRDKIIKKEEKAVRRARMIVVGAFVACATAVSVAVYKFASRADFRNFELEVRRWLEDDTCLRTSKQQQQQQQQQ